MKNKFKLYISAILFLSLTAFSIYELKNNSTRSAPYIQEDITKEIQENDDPIDDIEARMKYEIDMLKDPKTGKIPEGIRESELEFAKRIQTKEQIVDNPENLNTYTSLGPTNIGGRTRAFAYDATNPTMMIAGGISSGIYKTIDGGADWINKTPNTIHNVSTICQDPMTHTTWYYGTGELISNSANEFVHLITPFGY